MKFGQFEIRTFVEHRLKFDGGSMFGVVPRVIWERLVQPDAANRIDMNVNLFVLTAHGKNIMFDSGLGDTLSDRERTVYGVQGESTMESGLSSLGLTADDIDYVILSHLHTDHAAGAVKLVDGELVPRFARARYAASRQEWSVAVNPDERSAAAYVPERYRALADSGRLDLFDADTEPLPGVRLVITGGHTKGHTAVEMKSEGHKVFYYADLFSTSFHLPVAYIPAADMYPARSLEVKREKLTEVISDDVALAFPHDTGIPLGRVRRDGKKLLVEKVKA